MPDPQARVRAGRVARWVARTVSAGLLGAALWHLVFQGGLSGFAGSTTQVLATFFLLAACAGLAVGWGWEGAGGLLTVGSIAALNVVELVATGELPRGWLISLVALGGFLFVLSRALNVAARHESSP